MADERTDLPLPDLARWLVLAALVAAGIALYLWLAPGIPPVVEPATPNWKP
jgi:hypothetical protein